MRLNIGACGETVGERLGGLPQVAGALAGEQEHLSVTEAFGQRAGGGVLEASRVVDACAEPCEAAEQRIV